MDRAVDAFLTELDPRSCDAFEISGNGHQGRAWRSYLDLWYPDFDLLDPAPIGEFDVVICEQVLEHVTEPWQSMQTLAKLCKPGGHVIITTPFMLRIHAFPLDLWRFTPDGMAEVARSAGLEVVGSGSWGNTWCIVANRKNWAVFRPWHRLLSRFTLANDPVSPQVVWTFARKPDATS